MGLFPTASSASHTVEKRLADRTLALVDIPSVSRSEERLTQALRSMMPEGMTLLDDEDGCLVYGPPEPRRPVVFAGHTDTVPPQGNLPGKATEGAVYGLGACDMKGGLAVMVELACAASAGHIPIETAFVFFPREELPFTESPIPGVLERNPWIAGAALVIVLEPTSNTVHAGCLGNLNADAVYMGASAHSARPWLGDNAAHKAIASLAAIVGFSPRPVLVEGLEFIEVVNVTGLSGGLARNVIPAEVRCHINFRYAPGRAPQDAEEELASLLGPAAGLEIVGNAPPGAVVRNNPLVDALAQESGRPVAPKQAWTNVAEFTAAGIDAVNFGPGDPQVAHRADERVEARSLVRCYERLTAALIRHAKIEG